MGRDCPSPRRPVREVHLQNIQIITLAVMRALSLRIYDAGAGADEAHEALHSRVRASNRFSHSKHLYGVLGDLLGDVQSQRQILDQLATAHAANRSLAFDNG